MGFKISHINENVIRNEMIGHFTAEDALAYEQEIKVHYEEADSIGKQLHIYVDTSQFEKLSVEGRRTFSKMNQDNRLGRIASTGGNRILNTLARFIMIASKRNNIRYFSSEEEALDWLKSAD